MSKSERQNARVAAAKRAKNRKIIITVAVVLAVLIIMTPLVMFSNGSFYRVATAMTVGTEKYSVTDFNYYYSTAFQTAYSNIYATYGDYASYFIDTSAPLDEQIYSGDTTWDDYLSASAVETMRTVVMLNDEAEANGFVLSQEQEQELTTVIDETYATAELLGYTVNGYLQAMYGAGMNRADFEENTREAFIAETYANQVLNAQSYTEEELMAAYETDRNSYDYVSYRMYAISGVAEEGEDTETAMADARAEADAMVERVNAGEEFADVIYDVAPEDLKESYADPEYTLASSASYSSVSSTIYGEWLFDTARTEGDLEVFEASEGYTLIQFIGRDDNDYNSRDFRHILIEPETDEEGNVTEEALAAAKAEAEELYAQWQDGEATEESFAALADEHSDDDEDLEGGLYDNIPRNQVKDVLDDWLFTELQPGDTALLESEYGYHIVYYVGENANVRMQLVENAQRSSDYNAWIEEKLVDYPANTDTFGYRFAGNV